ncbi:MAG: hypothetical protein IJR89_04500 [Clostridia bacterium]|nr:hypothetical protein [Clostridia bacterium]
MNDWRLTDQAEYLFEKELKYQIYRPQSKDWDHDHCEFCGDKFSELEGDLHIGYTANDGYYWICEKCFNDFKVQFHWTVKKTEN